MRFGTFHLIGSPELAPAEQRVAETLEQIVLADELGFDYAWIAEHHFSNYGYSVNPLLITAQAAALAKRIRFAQAIFVVPFWQPVRLAEDIALTDILTGGRLDIGVGRGYQPMEFRGLNLDIADNTVTFRESLEVMKKCWSENDFTYDGQIVKVPAPITVLPRPLQQPHPPIWMATQSDDSLDWAAEQGYRPLLGGGTLTWEQIGRQRERFEQRWLAAGHPREDLRIALQRYVYVTETEQEAREAEWQTRWQRNLAYHLRADDARLQAGINEQFPFQGEVVGEPWWDQLAYGTPDRCIAQLRRAANLGFTDLITWFDVGGVPGDKILQSMRLFAREVMPAFAAVRV